ncbi:type III-A CRISPR-associated RAMP protein Csm4 [Mammaliicoccus sciuri]|uniref:type III-A CRISPR-associated RAMP protein Csm4 n=1 Tax=Mammaliicoccus sciuri TaxID=1296 RepID=UPI002DB5874D|nr:type III-A CRISPR-associated RAMP protein Csm4 [Mammaliicoccus sciuri]MEB7816245.1 type III-A CRISPR-associated RAMP protein Csm4 [Mammaliicoccus sciuri]
MPTKIYKLNFKDAVHFGKKRLSDSEMTIASDTLFSALYIEALQMNMPTDWLLNELLISDTFPFEQEIFYLPKPLIKITSSEEGNHKDFKKLKYIPAYHYNDYIQGRLSAEDAKDLNEIFEVGKYSLQTKVSLQAQIDDPNIDSEPYSVGTFRFEDYAGLYFIANGTQQSLSYLEEVLNSLQYSGLGGKRSAGYGRFRYSLTDNKELLSLLDIKGSQYVLLSTAMAKDSEIENVCTEARYILKKRSGFVQSQNYADNIVKKRDFYSFTPGSVFNRTFEGDIYNVGDSGKHPVYRYAKPLWLEV